jgi:hypothetical protein
VCTTRYAIASVLLNPLSTTQKLVFCESVGRGEGYGAGRGIQPGELGRVVTLAMDVGKEIVEASDEEVLRLQKETQ